MRFVAALLIALTLAAPARAATKPPQPPTVVLLHGDVDDDQAASIEKALANATGPVSIDIDSPGGSVDAALREMRAIESAKVPVTCEVDGMAASAAYLILQSCPVRKMSRRSTLMFHEVRVTALYSGQPTQWLNAAALLEAVTVAMCEQATRRMHVSAQWMRERIRGGRELWLTYREAKRLGAIDRVTPWSNHAP